MLNLNLKSLMSQLNVTTQPFSFGLSDSMYSHILYGINKNGSHSAYVSVLVAHGSFVLNQCHLYCILICLSHYIFSYIVIIPYQHPQFYFLQTLW